MVIEEILFFLFWAIFLFILIFSLYTYISWSIKKRNERIKYSRDYHFIDEGKEIWDLDLPFGINLNVKDVKKFTPLISYGMKIPYIFNNIISLQKYISDRVETYLIPELKKLQEREKNYLIINKASVYYQLHKTPENCYGHIIINIYGIPKRMLDGGIIENESNRNFK